MPESAACSGVAEEALEEEVELTVVFDRILLFEQVGLDEMPENELGRGGRSREREELHIEDHFHEHETVGILWRARCILVYKELVEFKALWEVVFRVVGSVKGVRYKELEFLVVLV